MNHITRAIKNIILRKQRTLSNHHYLVMGCDQLTIKSVKKMEA